MCEEQVQVQFYPHCNPRVQSELVLVCALCVCVYVCARAYVSEENVCCCCFFGGRYREGGCVDVCVCGSGGGGGCMAVGMAVKK